MSVYGDFYGFVSSARDARCAADDVPRLLQYDVIARAAYGTYVFCWRARANIFRGRLQVLLYGR